MGAIEKRAAAPRGNSKPWRVPVAVVLAGLVVAAVSLMPGCMGEEEADFWQGYVEGEFVEVAPPLGGELRTLFVARGDVVQRGDALFVLERDFERAGVEEARENLRQAENTLADLSKGSRPSELAAIMAQLREARATMEQAGIEYRRREKLFAEHTISAEERDRAKTEYDTAQQQVRRYSAELQTARLGGRKDAVGAAEAEVRAALARLAKAQWNYEQKARSAPVSGVVFDTVREPGEWVPAGGPVVSLLPPQGRIVRFFVPETEVASLLSGAEVSASVDGVEQAIPCRVTYVSPQAEYTPPVIYSTRIRAKLVYRVEARPVDAARYAASLPPGLPVDVRLTGMDVHPVSESGAAQTARSGGGNE